MSLSGLLKARLDPDGVREDFLSKCYDVRVRKHVGVCAGRMFRGPSRNRTRSGPFLFCAASRIC